MNYMPMISGLKVVNSMDPQECFNKALETMADLKPTAEKKQYSDSKLRLLRAAYLLTKAEMLMATPPKTTDRREHKRRERSSAHKSTHTGQT